MLISPNVSSLVIDRLCDHTGRGNSTVACLYFDIAAQKEQSFTNMLGALLKQVVSGLEETPEEILRAYRGRGSAIGGRGPPLAHIVKMLQIISSKKQTFICIDAVDECAEGYRVKLLNSLNQILQKSPGTRIFVTGRPYIRPEIGRLLSGRVVSVVIGPKRDDIIRYLSSRLEEDTIPDAMDGSLEVDILRKIPGEISDMYVEAAIPGKNLKLSTDRCTFRFLLVALNIEAILQETTIHRRRQKLNTMTHGLGLGDAYGATLDRIKGQGGDKARLGMAALMWISHAERPLNPDELLHALAIETESPDLNSDNIPSIGTLLACCQGLIAVDKEASTIRLIHYTLREYLQAHPDLSGTAHSTIGETCLSYLNSHQVRALSTTPSPDLQSLLFLEYSSLYWGAHVKRDLSDRAKVLALKLFGNYNNHISTKILVTARRPFSEEIDFHKLSRFSGLHCASIFGIDEIVASLLEVEGCDPNIEDCVGNTPLVWAALNGHEGVVKILLGRDDVKPEKEGEFGDTPLCSAAGRGHEGLVKILLDRNDVNPENPGDCGQTPLCSAAVNGREGVVKILLGRDDVSPEKPGFFGHTPLYLAASSGQEGVVKILLGRDDVNPDKPGEFGQTPLGCAASRGHEGVVKILLGRDDVDPEKPGFFEQTPLCYAASRGHEGVVKILLERDDVNPEKPGQDEQTPLCCAAEHGYEGVVEILLERDDVNPEKQGKWEETPLWFATEYGHEGVVKILLGRDDFDPTTG